MITVIPEMEVVECQLKKKGCKLTFLAEAVKGDEDVSLTSRALFHKHYILIHKNAVKILYIILYYIILIVLRNVPEM